MEERIEKKTSNAETRKIQYLCFLYLADQLI